MSTPSITPEQKTKILGALKSGTTLPDLAKEYRVSEDAIIGLLSKDTNKAPANTGEVTRLQKEIQQLKELLGALLIERELAKKKRPPTVMA